MLKTSEREWTSRMVVDDHEVIENRKNSPLIPIEEFLKEKRKELKATKKSSQMKTSKYHSDF